MTTISHAWLSSQERNEHTQQPEQITKCWCTWSLHGSTGDREGLTIYTSRGLGVITEGDRSWKMESELTFPSWPTHLPNKARHWMGCTLVEKFCRKNLPARSRGWQGSQSVSIREVRFNARRGGCNLPRISLTGSLPCKGLGPKQGFRVQHLEHLIKANARPL